MRALRSFPLHAHLDAFVATLRRPYQREEIEMLLLGTGYEPFLKAATRPAAPAGPPRGRPATPVDTVLTVAVAYARAAKAGSRRPGQDAARSLGAGWSAARVRDYVHRARVSTPPLLYPAAQGKPGGGLTPHAQSLLRARGARSRATLPKSKTRRTRRR
jgi:hypothetical protein